MTPAPRKLALALLLAASAAACTSARGMSCAELRAAADAKQCPERTVTTTVTVFQPLALGDLPEAPPITSAELPEGIPAATALAAVAQDLREARSWGWTLFHMLVAVRDAAALPPAPPAQP